MTAITLQTDHGPAQAHVHDVEAPQAVLVLGHGAGGGVAAPDLLAAREIAMSVGVSVALIEQPYRVAGRRSPPPAWQLDVVWMSVVDQLRRRWFHELRLVVGGRSSGARVACRTAGATDAVGVLCMAFPLQPPQGKRPVPRPSRLAELDIVPVPTLVVQGERDSFGIPPAAARRTVLLVPGDHSLRKGLGSAIPVVADWLQHLART